MSVAVVEGCPAFSDGCPFGKLERQFLPEVIRDVTKDISLNCPAFENGCPFKEEDSVEALYTRLSEMPASHRMGQKCPAPAAKEVEATLQLVHEQSKLLKAKLNATCPVFATSCPFKTVTSDGQLLVQELDDVVERWGLKQFEDIVQPVMAEQLSKTMKAATRTVHRAAENVRFVRDFMRGAVPRDSYVELLRALYHVYDALEQNIRALPERFQHCEFSKLWRTEALLADLCHYTGNPPPATAGDLCKIVGEPSEVARQYVDRLHDLAGREPLLLLAHAYTRYLGDLSGGQILARAAQKAYGLHGSAGTAFYNFTLVGSTTSSVKEFKRAYRASLDALRLTAQEADALVDEANTAFLMNMLIFEDRDVAAGHLDRLRTVGEVREMVASNRSAAQFQKAYAGGDASAGKCPFLPPPEQRGSTQAQAGGRACPWPFIWLHSPRAALLGHPVKNVCSTVAFGGFAVFARKYPRGTAAGSLLCGLGCYLLKPKHSKALEAESAAGGEAVQTGHTRANTCPFMPAPAASGAPGLKANVVAGGEAVQIVRARANTCPFMLAPTANGAGDLKANAVAGGEAVQTSRARACTCPLMLASRPTGAAEAGHDRPHPLSESPVHSEQRLCPMPCVWLHDPDTALVSHPVACAGGVLSLVVLARVAWHCPCSCTLAYLASLAGVRRLKPKKHGATKKFDATQMPASPYDPAEVLKGG